MIIIAWFRNLIRAWFSQEVVISRGFIKKGRKFLHTTPSLNGRNAERLHIQYWRGMLEF